MFLTRCKVAAALAVLLALLGIGAAGILTTPHPNPPPPVGGGQGGGDRPAQQPGPQGGEAALHDRAGDPLPGGALARLGTVRFRHGEYVHCAVFTRDGKTLITTGADAVIRLWEVPTGRPLRQLEGHRGWVGNLALSRDGSTLASGGTWWDHSLRVWDLASGKELRCLDRGDFPVGQPIAFAPDGKTLYAVREREIEVWEVGRGRKLRSLRPLPERTGGLADVALSPDGRALAATNSDADPAERFGRLYSGGTLRLLDSRTGKELCKRSLKAWAPGLVSFAPDGRTLALQGGSAIQIWSADLEKELLRIPTPETNCNRFAFSPDSRLLAVAAFNGASAPFRIRVWELRSGKECREFPGHDHFVNALAFAPDGKTLASGSAGASVRLWDLASGAEVPQPAAHHGWVWGIAVSPDGQRVATANSDRTVRVWEAHSGKPLRVLRGHEREVWAVRFAPAGNVLASGSWDGTVRLWDADSGKELHRLAGHAGEVRAVAFSPEGKLLASGVRGTDARIHLWDVGTGRAVGHLPLGQPTPVTALAFSPDGQHLASGGDGIRLWDVARKRSLPWFRPQVEGAVEGLAYSADGRTLFSLGKRVQLWETVTGRERASLKPPAGHGFSTAAFAPDGRRVVTTLNAGGRVVTTRTQVLEFWDAFTGKSLGRRTGHVGLVGTAAWASDGRLLVTGADDTSALVWDTAPLVCRKGPTRELAPARVEALWEELKGPEAARAGKAIEELVHAPRQAVALLARRLKPVPHVAADRIARLLRELDDTTFRVRDRAAAELQGLGEVGERALRAVLKESAPLETRRRLERVLERIESEPIPGETVRAVRAVEILERIGGREASALLEALAAGNPEGRPTREARAALRRLTSAARHSFLRIPGAEM
jgi:WD40 repeat protein